MRIILIVLFFLIVPLFKVEAGEYINKHLPSWVNVDLQYRHRYEWRQNFDFNNNINDKDGFNLWRSRFGLTIKPSEDLKFYYQFQDSRISDDSLSGLKATSENWAETRQIWAELKTDKLVWEAIDLSKVGVKLGRQELSYGGQRLLGAGDWSNIPTTFDAGKILFEFDQQKLIVDVFGGGKTPVKTPREQDDLYDGAANDRLIGYYGTYKGIKDLSIEQYMLSRNTDGTTVSFGQVGDGEIEDYTFGARVVGKIPDTGFDYELEAAKQVGNSGALDADAQMAVAILGYTFDTAWKPRLSFEFNYGSGDNDRSDDKRQTFNNIHPTNHMFYGYMDFASLQNINNYHIQLKADPHKKLNLQADWHMIYLDTSKDNLYGANKVTKRATVAGADDFVGNELDFLVKFQICKFASTMVGYSHFFAGDFLKDTGSSDDADFLYVQTVINF